MDLLHSDTFGSGKDDLKRLAKVEDTKGPSKKAGRESGKAFAGFRCFWNYGLRQLGIYSDKGVTRAASQHVNVLFQTKPTSIL